MVWKEDRESLSPREVTAGGMTGKAEVGTVSFRASCPGYQDTQRKEQLVPNGQVSVFPTAWRCGSGPGERDLPQVMEPASGRRFVCWSLDWLRS